MSTFGSNGVNRITKSIFAASACVLLSSAVTAQETPSSATPAPNILFILIDDLGWMDLACQGNKLVETPHIDRLVTLRACDSPTPMPPRPSALPRGRRS